MEESSAQTEETADIRDATSRQIRPAVIASTVGAVLLLFGISYHYSTASQAQSSSLQISPAIAAAPEPAAAPLVSTPSGYRRVSPHGVVSDPVSTSDTLQVDYFNPNTGTSSTYYLEVDLGPDGAVERINFPNEGWLEVDGNTTDNGDGTQTYTRDNGAEYTVHVEDDGGSSASDDDSRNSTDLYERPDDESDESRESED